MSLISGRRGIGQTAPARRDSALLPVPERVKVVLAMLTAAAERGEPAPNNAVMATAIGASSAGSVASAVSLLETANVITVVRSRSARVVTINATGKRTAGHIEKPIDYGKGRARNRDGTIKRRPFWTAARDATLMQRIADGADFEQAAVVCGASVNEASARFDELRHAMGWQAA